MKRLHLIILFLTVAFTFGCKQDSGSFDLLISGDTSSVEDLEITARIPDQANITLEVGQTSQFVITAVAPAPRFVSYSWKLNGNVVTANQTYTFAATAGLIGQHTLTAIASDGETLKENVWTIKVNGPPTINPITTGTPKVSTGSSIQIQATASDPNSDSLTYEWLLNGATSSYLTGTTGTGTLTGHSSIVGPVTVTLRVSDGTSSTSYNWSAEVNYFPMACNTLTQGQICTYAGNPHKGSGLAANNTEFPLRFRPFKHTQDAIGNFFISDIENNVVWYWNLTASPVNRIGLTIPANTIQVVAGTGESATGGVGIPATTSALNNPRGLWYDDVGGILYIAEYSGNQVKYVDSSGTIFVGMGGGTSHVAGDTAYNHDCNAPMDMAYYSNNLYVSCYSHNRIKRWDLTSGLAYVVVGDGGNDNAGENADPLLSGIGQPYSLFVDNTGIYVASTRNHLIRFVNTTGAPITFWSGNPDQVIVNAGMIATIIGNGASTQTSTGGNPLSEPLGTPTSVIVRNGNEIYIAGQTRDIIVMANNSGAPVTIDNLTVNPGTLARINFNGGGYNGEGSGINATRINDPYNLSIDINDNDQMIFTDYSNYRFRALNFASGKVSLLAGSGRGSSGFYGDVPLPTTSHLFDYPSGLAFDNNSRILFFADQNNHRLRQVDAYGVLSTAAGRGAGDPTIDNDIPSNVLMRTNYNNTNAPLNGFDIWSDGTLAQLNSYGHNIRLWNRTDTDQSYLGVYVQSDRIATVAGDYLLGAGTGPDGPALTSQLNYPNSVKFYDNAGVMEMFVVDSLNHCIRRVDNNGDMTVVLGTCGVAGDPGNAVAAGLAQFNRPRDIAFDELGNMFISDENNHHIWYWNRTGASVSVGSITVLPGDISTVGCLSGTAGSSAENFSISAARCNQPAGMAYFDGRLCFAQRARHNVRCFRKSNGLVSTVAGSLESSPRAGRPFDFSQEGILATNASLYNPADVAFDDNGDLYISDSNNHIVRKVKLSADE